MATAATFEGGAAAAVPIDWAIARAAPGAATTPADAQALAWQAIDAPCTAAAALAQSGIDPFSGAIDIDAFDWWYRARLAAQPQDASLVLRFAALAGVAEVWLDDERILDAANAFIEHRVALDARPARGATLMLRFPSLVQAIGARRPRPRWKTRLVTHQQLRWFRTSLLGRMPGWCPPVPTVGIAGPVTLERDPLLLGRPLLRTSLDGADGRVRLTATADPSVTSAVMDVGGERVSLDVGRNADGSVSLAGHAVVPNAPLWWPHTHGDQPLFEVTLVVHAGEREARIALGRIGFRTVQVAEPAGDFAFVWNGTRVFMRGAVWTPLDLVAGAADPARLREALLQCRDAGMNMIRIAGITTYESDLFHALCDELGIAVWQDCMFANLDYPAADAGFVANVREEMRALGARLAGRPSTAFLCGSSEVAQQASMLGLPADAWSNALFDAVIPQTLAEALPDVPYAPSTPWGGALPFHPGRGIAHYYGVGAYLREPDDARRADVKFAAETLAFSNVPEPETIEALLGDGEAPPTHPRWKARIPRDRGVGWDFEDVREHYLGRLFAVNPTELRHADVERWLALGRVATGAMMEHTFAEWRRHGSRTSGGLVFMLRDPWPGAGWGVVDAHGRPKAAWHALRRAFAPVGVFITDEGLNGLALHLVNETPIAREVDVSLALYRHGETATCTGHRQLRLDARTTVRLDGDALLEHFSDATLAYRFGPPGHDVAVARLTDADGTFLHDAFHFPSGPSAHVEPDVGLAASARPGGDGEWIVTLAARRLATWVRLETPGAQPLDNHLHLAPGVPRDVRVRCLPGCTTDPVRWRAQPLNAAASAKVTLASPD